MSQSLNSTLSSLTRRLNDLDSFQLPRLKSCLGPLDLHKELVEEMRNDLELIRYNIDVAKEITYSITSFTDKEQIVNRIRELEEQYISLKNQFREIMLESKKNILSRKSRIHELSEKSKNKYELNQSKIKGDFLNDDDDDDKEKAKSAIEFGMGGDDELQTKTNEVTIALKRTTELMQIELEKSVLSIQTLDSSTQNLISTSNLYQNYKSILNNSNQIIKLIEKSNFFDKILILSFLSFFLIIIGFIIKRRIFNKTFGFLFINLFKGFEWYFLKSTKLIKNVSKFDNSYSNSPKNMKTNLEKGNERLDLQLNKQFQDSKINEDSAVINNTVPDKGKVEIILNDQNDHIKPEWIKDEL
ncbi:uncharacterized protein I206_105579 [Kwoniella pini CBS 10737]|uniref:Sec20 C-terminal domain-containing protein n=1 Tax=Kwoniella pini CBS 10737 TaxID=1296096 RepID=A0AAJ8L971_9TREE